MKVRLPLAIAAALLSATALTSPALAIEQVHIPDSSAADNSGPPDALFDKSIPTTWQQKQQLQQNQSNNNGLGNFHFSATSGNGYSQQSTNTYFGGAGTASNPGGEFHQNGVALYPDAQTPH